MSLYPSLILGWYGQKAVADAIAALGLTVTCHGKPANPLLLTQMVDDSTHFSINTDIYTQPLHHAWTQTAVLLEWTCTETTKRDAPRYVLSTPWGMRESTGFSLQLQYDPEYAHDTPADISFGIPLSSLYFPGLLDMKNEHGGLPNVIAMDAYHHAITLAQDTVARTMLYFATAKPFVRIINT